MSLDADLDIFSLYRKDKSERTASSAASSAPDWEDELNTYLNEERALATVNVLQWWKDHQKQFPNLAKMARDYLAIPATSVSVHFNTQVIFSSSEYYISKHTLVARYTYTFLSFFWKRKKNKRTLGKDKCLSISDYECTLKLNFFLHRCVSRTNKNGNGCKGVLKKIDGINILAQEHSCSLKEYLIINEVGKKIIELCINRIDVTLTDIFNYVCRK